MAKRLISDERETSVNMWHGGRNWIESSTWHFGLARDVVAKRCRFASAKHSFPSTRTTGGLDSDYNRRCEGKIPRSSCCSFVYRAGRLNIARRRPFYPLRFLDRGARPYTDDTRDVPETRRTPASGRAKLSVRPVLRRAFLRVRLVENSLRRYVQVD